MLRLLALVPLLASACLAQKTVADVLEQKTIAKVRAAADSTDAVGGFAAVDLNTGRTFSHNGDVVFPQASSIKIAIMTEMFRSGRFRMPDPVTLSPKDAVGGSGRLQHRLKNGPVTITVRELITAMIEWSDNTATNKCIDMAGMANVNRTVEELGLRNTRLQRKMMDLAAARRNEENISTPLDMARLVELIYQGKAAPPETCREMIAIMKLVSADMRSIVPDDIEVASKPGQIDGVRCETGIIFLPNRPFALSVASAYLSDRRSPVPDVTDIIFGHFQRLARANKYGRYVE